MRKIKKTPDQVSYSSKDCFWFVCPVCNREFQKALCNVTAKNNINPPCPCCSKRAMCNENDCKLCFDKSFASHEKSKYWSKKNKITPREVSKCKSGIKYYFDCNVCEHELKIEPCKIVCYGVWCSYCANTQLCADEKCKICFDKSFASHPRSEEWIYEKNDCSPRDIFFGTTIRYYLKCKDCKHELYVAPNGY